MPTDPPKRIDGRAAGATRLSGKTASDAFKGGNNAGMIFKKQAKAAGDGREYRRALERLRIEEKGPRGDSLRRFYPEI